MTKLVETQTYHLPTIILLLTCAYSVVNFSLTAQSETSSVTVKIGVIGPIDRLGTYDPGKRQRRAMEFVQEKEYGNWARLPDGVSVELIFVDDKSDPDLARQQAEKLIDSGVALIIGSINSSCTLALGKEATATKTPVITAISTATGLLKEIQAQTNQSSPWVFRISPPDNKQMENLADALKGFLDVRNGRYVALLYEGYNPYYPLQKGIQDIYGYGLCKDFLAAWDSPRDPITLPFERDLRKGRNDVADLFAEIDHLRTDNGWPRVDAIGLFGLHTDALEIAKYVTSNLAAVKDNCGLESDEWLYLFAGSGIDISSFTQHSDAAYTLVLSGDIDNLERSKLKRDFEHWLSTHPEYGEPFIHFDHYVAKSIDALHIALQCIITVFRDEPEYFQTANIRELRQALQKQLRNAEFQDTLTLLTSFNAVSGEANRHTLRTLALSFVGRGGVALLPAIAFPRADPRLVRGRYWYLSFIIDYLKEHKWPWLFVIYGGLLLLWTVLLFIWPWGLFLINAHLKRFPEMPSGSSMKLTLSLRHLCLIYLFSSSTRVLDAWVTRHMKMARERYDSLETVKDRKVYIPLSVLFNGELVTEMSPTTLRSIFHSNTRTCVLIQGEGGIGKTSLACQIGHWVLSEDKERHLTAHPMLPVIIEDEFVGGLIETSRGKLQSLVGKTDIDPDLFAELLKDKRILLIVDRLSEMSEETRREVNADAPDFSVGALIVTSRRDETKLGPKSVIEPLRLQRTKIPSFLETYLSLIDRPDLFSNDLEFYDACGRLSQLGRNRDITVLLAKLYIDQLLSSVEENSLDEMPTNIPALMIRYLDSLEPKERDTEGLRRTRQDAEKVAWECEKVNFLPSVANREVVIESLSGDGATARLEYLEETIRIVKVEGSLHDQVRFTLDPLADYLAALRVIEMCQGSRDLWSAFIVDGGKRDPLAARGFLIALRDCCLTTNVSIPEGIVDEIGKLVA